MGRAVIAEQLARLGRAADDQIPGTFELSSGGVGGEPGRTKQPVPAIGAAAVELPDPDQNQGGQHDGYVGRDLAIAKDALQPGVGRQQHHKGAEQRPGRANAIGHHQLPTGVIASAGSASG